MNKYLLCLIVSGSVALSSQTAERRKVEVIKAPLTESSQDYYTGKIDGLLYKVMRTQKGGTYGFNYRGELPKGATVTLEQAYKLLSTAAKK